MALSIEKNTPFGPMVKARYWRIIQTNINWFNRTASVQIAGFTDEESYKAGAQAIAQVTFEWYQDKVAYNIGQNQNVFDCKFPFSPVTGVLAAAYSTIKTLETWQLAEDC